MAEIRANVKTKGKDNVKEKEQIERERGKVHMKTIKENCKGKG